MSKQRIAWIDGIKGLACMIVFWNHFYLVFLGNSQVITEQIHKGIADFFQVTNILVNGNFGVCIFVIISGYLANSKKIDTLVGLGKAVLLRYLKFVLAFLAVLIIYVLLELVIGYGTVSWGQKYLNTWVELFYRERLTFIDCCKGVLSFKQSMSMPLWTIMPLFLGNVLIFAVNYLTRNRLQKLRVVIALVFIVAGFVFGYPGYRTWSQIVLYTGYSFVGMLLPYLWKFFSKWKEWILGILLICAIIGVNGGYRYVVSYASMVVRVPEVFYSQIYWNAALAIAIVAFVGGMPKLCNVLSKPFAQAVNRYSFPVYLFHFPIFCSIGLWLHDLLSSVLNQTITFLLMAVVMHLLVFGVAWVYNATWDKWSNNLLRKI